MALLIVVAALLCLVSWLYARRIPKARRGKIGFAVAIKADGTNQQHVRRDFVSAIRNLLNNGSTAQTFDFLEIPDHHCDIIDDEHAIKIAGKARATFLLFGTVRQRFILKELHEIVDLRSLVLHHAMPADVWMRFAQDIAGIVPSRAQFKTDGAVHAFEFTGHWAALAAKYEIALVACLSGSLDYGERLLMDLQGSPQVASLQFPAFSKLRQQIPEHLNKIAMTRTQQTLNEWSQTRNTDLVARVGLQLESAKAKGYTDNPWWITTQCLHEYLSSERPHKAIALLNRIPRKQRGAVWYLNRAYLLACKGDLKAASAAYRSAERLGIPPEEAAVVGQIESFLEWRTQMNPAQPEPRYCLAVVNWLLKGDLEQARCDFGQFLRLCGETKYQRECELVRTRWLPEIANGLSLATQESTSASNVPNG